MLVDEYTGAFTSRAEIRKAFEEAMQPEEVQQEAIQKQLMATAPAARRVR